ncbi:hypothetical protein SI65_00978 [Aspergillus cristatus]|uniref:Uncharacterized protein n=1 Tax=Aspergillus cristatus TaxID=573508 RepID=A0A1E3BR11_ASPCR|nr:hypothetical protein SI65_00978 [Aspergillus cristatus]
MQFALAEHRFYLTQTDRAPGGTKWPRGFEKCNQTVYETYGKHQPSGRFGLGGIRVFAQLYRLEPGDELQEILDVPDFYPRRVAVTIRYSDFWFWESNTPLHIDATWVNEIRLPDSVTYFTKWFFERRDGAILTARKEDISVSTWTGSSILGGQRWTGGDCPPRPCPNLDVPRDFVQPSPPFTQTDSINLRNLQSANVSLDTPAAEAWRAMQQYYESAYQGTTRFDDE